MDHEKKWDLAKENRQTWNSRTNDSLAREVLDQTDHLLEIPRPVFKAILNEALKRVNSDFEFNTQACDALQIATEDFTIKHIQDSGLCMSHRNAKTLAPKDMELVEKIREGPFELHSRRQGDTN